MAASSQHTTHRKSALPFLSSLVALALFACTAPVDYRGPVDGDKQDDLGGYESPDAGDRSCGFSAADSMDPDALDYSRLHELATRGLFKAAVLEVPACAPVMGDASVQTDMKEHLAQWGFGDLAEDFPDAVVSEGSQSGSRAFLRLLDKSERAIQERIDDGNWDPSSTPEGQDLQGRLSDLVSALRAEAISSPERHLEIEIEFENAECSEDVVGLFDSESNRLTALHRGPRC